MHAVISTGLEQDRTGSRNNDDTSPLAVQSIWGVAHEAGLQVHAASNLRWWEQLFPNSFDSYRFDLDETENFFVPGELATLSLIHPVRVDTAGHDHGAASREYKEAVAKVDEELLQLLGSLDLQQDLVVLTSDHGHSASGGHGGTASEIAMVLTCFAGPTIRPEASELVSDSRIIAPTLSVLLGLPFPKHMRAGDDHLDQIWSIVRTDLLGEAYVEERKAGIEIFRQENKKAVAEILGTSNAGWNEVYSAGTRRHQVWWLGIAVFLLAMLVLAARLRRVRGQTALYSLGWMLLGIALACLLYTFVRGSFDFTSINKRQEFLDASIGVSLSVSVAMAALHLLLWRDLPKLVLDHCSLLVVLVVVSFAHPLIYGVTLGFPLPGRVALFLPFILGALVISAGAVGGLFAGIALLRLSVPESLEAKWVAWVARR